MLLVVGAELLVRGASRLAAACGISPLVVGLTVVAFGTSAPEMAVSVGASVAGQGEIAFGNVVGSNIFNVLAILGLCALVKPLVVDAKLVRLDVPLMLGVSGLAWLLALDGSISRLEGGALFALLVAYTAFLIRASRRESAAARQAAPTGAGSSGVGDAPAPARRTLGADVLLVLAGLALLVFGSRWLVQGAVGLAQALGVSDLIIGLTIIAAGTSLPEVATSVLATIRGQRDIAVGNVVGSNVFNLLGVLGLSAVAGGGGLPVPASALAFDLPVMVAVALACLPIFATGHLIARWEGLLFFGYYLAYTGFLVLDTQKHDALPLFSGLMLRFILPLTAITLGVVSWRAWRRRAPSGTERAR